VKVILPEFFKHNRWANLLLLDACVSLTEEQLGAAVPGTYGPLGATLTHLVAAEESYLARLAQAERPDRAWADGPFPGVAALRERAGRSGAALIAAARQETAGRILRGTWRGEPYALPVAIVLLQAINHATEHRAHVATILSQLGIVPPDLDGWAYGEAMDAAADGAP
jgi:uncharacterized damage-inducible protein DinB